MLPLTIWYLLGLLCSVVSICYREAGCLLVGGGQIFRGGQMNMHFEVVRNRESRWVYTTMGCSFMLVIKLVIYRELNV